MDEISVGSRYHFGAQNRPTALDSSPLHPIPPQNTVTMLSARVRGRGRGKILMARQEPFRKNMFNPMLVGERILPYQPTGDSAACARQSPANALSADSPW
ncbi:MAG: hypothetical protein OSB20_09055 [Porticoccaceae bacterium]|nr:hypothetical protein [Porticoccaceae bacterium]